MKNRWLALLLALTLLAAFAFGAAAESFENTPTAVVTLGLGESLTLDTASLLVAEGKTLLYRSSDKKVASVSAEGVVTALKKGHATIAVGYDTTLLALCKVTVTAAPKRVTLSAGNMVLSVGDTQELTATLTKGSASALTFSSANDNIAAVDASGKVTGVSAGKTTVTVQTFNGKTAECNVYVLGGKAPTTLSLNSSGVNIQVGEVFQLVPSVDEGSDAYYKYASQDRKIARVNSNGEITGVKPGITSVAVRTHNGLTQTVGVTVKARLKDVYSVLTNEPTRYLKTVKKLKLRRDTTAVDSVVCGNDELTLTMTAGSCRVELAATANPKYCIRGIDVTMTPEIAAAKLIAGGWALTGSLSSNGVEQRAFTWGGDTTHFITIATADGTTIQSLTAQWNWRSEQ